MQYNRNRSHRLQSKALQSQAYEVHFDGAKLFEGTVLESIAFNRVRDANIFGINGKQIASDATLDSCYLVFKVRQGTQEPMVRVPLLDIEKASLVSEKGFPIGWTDIDYDSMRIISENKASHDADEGKVFELTVHFKHVDKQGVH